MRRIVKNLPPKDFISWKKRHPNADFRRLRAGRVKSNLKRALLEEQYWVCCYCCAKIRTPEAAHIEHLVPHSSGKQQTDYGNFLASCNGYEIRFDTCGHRKNSDLIPVTPLDPDCESRFIYSMSGEMTARPEDADALETIRVLNLNAPELVKARRTLIRMLITDSEIAEKPVFWASYYSTPCQGRLESFMPAAVYAIRHYL